MGKRQHVADAADQCETPQKRQKVAPALAAAPSPFVDSLISSSPALNMSFTLTREFVDGTILTDLALKDWRIGKPIGKGSFGEIFLASDNVFKPVTSENAKYVVKIEPHSNGPLFVEIHALLNTAKRTDCNVIPAGMPEYIASGSHYFKNERYRFLILKRYQRDLNSLIKNRRVDPASVPVIALQILDVLEHLHDKGYVHSDIKAENLMIGKVPASALLDLKSSKCFQEEPQSPAVGKKEKKHKVTSNGYHHNGLTCTPTVLTKKTASSDFSGTNPVRSCRNGSDEFVTSGTYQDMVKSHYLRPLKNIVYRDDSDEEDGKNGKKKGGKRTKKDGDQSKSFYFTITTKNVSENYKQIDVQVSRNGASLAATITESPKSSKNGLTKLQPDVREERIHLIDFGLASKFIDSTGQHRPFCMDQRRAHDGTLEFTSRDAHMGAHARRSDLECLGYNLIYWSRGFLPWKDEKMLNQPEQVHRMKEYFMTDVREMLKLIYGEECPKYLGEFLHYVGGLNYDDRPDYEFLRSLFCQELRRLGQKPCGPYLKLNVHNIVKLSEPLNAQDEAEITNKINQVKSLMKMGVLPYRESTLHNKTTSPKNLRSKRDSTRTPGNGNGMTKNGASTAKKEKPFSWSEILSTDPDQIARERAEKEFERADLVEEVVIKYTGNPTYAIRELESKRESGVGGGLEYTESEGYIRGYTKPMMDILRKRQSQLIRDVYQERNCGNGVKEPPDEAKSEAEEEPEQEQGEESDEEEEQKEEEEEEEVEEEGSDNESVCSDAASEADSGNDDVDGEEEEEEEMDQEDKVEEEIASDHSEVVQRKGKGRRRVLQSESSDQQDSDFNDQDTSENDSRDSRKKKSRGRPRLNRDQEKPRSKQPSTYSKSANAGNNTKVPVIAARHNNNNNKPYYGDVDDSSHDVPLSQQKFLLLKRRKSGLRERIRPTDRSAKYHDDLAQKKSKKSPRKRYSDDEDYRVDESSCVSSQSASSIVSTASTATTASSVNSDFSDATSVRKSSRKRTNKRSYSSSSRSVISQSSRSSSVHGPSNGHSEPAAPVAPAQPRPSAFAADEEDYYDDDDTRDMDYSPIKAKRGWKPTTVTAGGRRNGASIKKRPVAEVKGAAAATVAKVQGGGVVAGLRGKRGDHQVRTYSRG